MNIGEDEDQLEALLGRFPSDIAEEIIKETERNGNVTEIRIRKNRNITLTSVGRNIVLDKKIGGEDFEKLLMTFCRNSVYSYSDAIKEGYIPFADGIRIGVCGNAVCEGGKLIGVSDIRSMNIRIPHEIRGICGKIYDVIALSDFRAGVLIYSRPGVGKTTMLRDIILRLASSENPKRVAVVDPRRELETPMISGQDNIDVYSGYPKAAAIEMAVRTMSPEYIVCDEIGASEVSSIAAVRSSGVPIVASFHADNAESLSDDPNVRILCRAGVFDWFAGLTRKNRELSPDVSVFPVPEYMKRGAV